MPVFVVHEHHARHLHFDLRLEMEEVLKSWALPKGPSMDPGERRLAIQVEDHELDYASFEGTIPEGEYGAGRVAIWDRGDFQTLSGGLPVGRLEFALDGKKLRGAFTLVRLKGRKSKGNEWLLIKKKDGLEEPGFQLIPVFEGTNTAKGR